MSTPYRIVLCAGEHCGSDPVPVVVTDLDKLTQSPLVPPVLKRLLGLVGGFAPPPCDEEGRLTSLWRQFQVKKDDFLSMLFYIKTGGIMKGKTRYDVYKNFLQFGECTTLTLEVKAEAAQKKANEAGQQELIDEQRRASLNQLRRLEAPPDTPIEDVLSEYDWALAPVVHCGPNRAIDGWELCSLVASGTHVWCRKRKSEVGL